MKTTSKSKPLFKLVLGFSLIFALTPSSVIAGASSSEDKVVVDVELSPAGSFKAKTSKVSGYAVKTPSGYAAQNILVDLKSLSSGIELRDRHMKERLMIKEHPYAKLLKAIGKDGKGRGLLEIKGIKREVAGVYTIEGRVLKATFKINLPDYKIEDIRYMGVGVEDEITVHVTVPIQEVVAPVQASGGERKTRSPASTSRF